MSIELIRDDNSRFKIWYKVKNTLGRILTVMVELENKVYVYGKKVVNDFDPRELIKI